MPWIKKLPDSIKNNAQSLQLEVPSRWNKKDNNAQRKEGTYLSKEKMREASFYYTFFEDPFNAMEANNPSSLNNVLYLDKIKWVFRFMESKRKFSFKNLSMLQTVNKILTMENIFQELVTDDSKIKFLVSINYYLQGWTEKENIEFLDKSKAPIE